MRYFRFEKRERERETETETETERQRQREREREKKKKAVSRKDLDLRGVAGQAVQSMFVVTIREKQTTFCPCSASTTCHCLAESTRCQPVPPQRGNGNLHCEFSSPPKHLCVDFSDNKPTLSNNAPEYLFHVSNASHVMPSQNVKTIKLQRIPQEQNMKTGFKAHTAA